MARGSGSTRKTRRKRTKNAKPRKVSKKSRSRSGIATRAKTPAVRGASFVLKDPKPRALEVTEAETLVDRAEWLLRELDPKSDKPVKDMEPTDGLKTHLGLNDLNVRSLTGSMNDYVAERNPGESVSKAEVEKAKTIRGELKLLQKKIEGKEPGDDEADQAISDAKERF